MKKEYYFISNTDNQIYKASEVKCHIIEGIDLNHTNRVEIEILSDDKDNEDEVIDCVTGYESLGDLYESMNGGNDLE